MTSNTSETIALSGKYLEIINKYLPENNPQKPYGYPISFSEFYDYTNVREVTINAIKMVKRTSSKKYLSEDCIRAQAYKLYIHFYESSENRNKKQLKSIRPKENCTDDIRKLVLALPEKREGTKRYPVSFETFCKYTNFEDIVDENFKKKIYSTDKSLATREKYAQELYKDFYTSEEERRKYNFVIKPCAKSFKEQLLKYAEDVEEVEEKKEETPAREFEEKYFPVTYHFFLKHTNISALAEKYTENNNDVDVSDIKKKLYVEFYTRPRSENPLFNELFVRASNSEHINLLSRYQLVENSNIDNRSQWSQCVKNEVVIQSVEILRPAFNQPSVDNQSTPETARINAEPSQSNQDCGENENSQNSLWLYPVSFEYFCKHTQLESFVKNGVTKREVYENFYKYPEKRASMSLSFKPLPKKAKMKMLKFATRKEHQAFRTKSTEEEKKEDGNGSESEKDSESDSFITVIHNPISQNAKSLVPLHQEARTKSQSQKQLEENHSSIDNNSPLSSDHFHFSLPNSVSNEIQRPSTSADNAANEFKVKEEKMNEELSPLKNLMFILNDSDDDFEVTEFSEKAISLNKTSDDVDYAGLLANTTPLLGSLINHSLFSLEGYTNSQTLQGKEEYLICTEAQRLQSTMSENSQQQQTQTIETSPLVTKVNPSSSGKAASHVYAIVTNANSKEPRRETRTESNVVKSKNLPYNVPQVLHDFRALPI